MRYFGKRKNAKRANNGGWGETEKRMHHVEIKNGQKKERTV